MTQEIAEIATFLATLHPYDTLLPSKRSELATHITRRATRTGETIYAAGTALPGLFIITSGEVEVRTGDGDLVSLLGPGNSFGERGLLNDGTAVTTARCTGDALLYVLAAPEFQRLHRTEPVFRRYYDRSPALVSERKTLDTMPISELMARGVITCSPGDTAISVAQTMRDRRVSCVVAVDQDRLAGILTTKDLTNRVLAEGLPSDIAVSTVLTPDPYTLDPDDLGGDALQRMMEHGIGHLPVLEHGRLVGIVTRTDLIRVQAVSSSAMVHEIAEAGDVDALAREVARIPELLAQLIGAGQRHEAVTRLVTDIADAATRRLLAMAEATLGPPPVPYLWLACGSQGRQEQTGLSDQDNCLMLDDAATEADDAYFADLARIVCDGLDRCGYFYCPGEMMATTPRWRQPVRVWREYFAGWVARPDPMAQMLASVMFDLRPIGGETALFENLQADTLKRAASNSIFVAHMASNSLKHTPPLGLFGGLATLRSGEHKDTVDLKLNGVVPVVDLGRIYAIQGQVGDVNTRARLQAAGHSGTISKSGARDLLDAYDLIATMRLRHQATQVRAGVKPDNFMAPGGLSDLERSHLRDAFVVIKTMQSALGQGRAAVM